MPSSKNLPPVPKPKKLKKEQLLQMDVNSLGYNLELPVERLSKVRRLHRAEFRKQRPNVMKRVGHAALDSVAVTALVTANAGQFARAYKAGYKDTFSGNKDAGKAYTEQANKHAEQARRSPRKLRRIGNFVTDVAMGRLSKRRERLAQEDKLWMSTHSEAADIYREKNPDVAQHEAKLQQQKLEFEDNMARGRTMLDPIREGQRTSKHFKARNVASFSDGIPRQGQEYWGGYKFEGDYGDLAKAVLTTAITKRQTDGSVPLLGDAVQRQRFLEREADGKSLADIRVSEGLYSGGAATALWQLGFVKFESAEDIPYGRGEFNPDISWTNTPENTTIAQIPLDPENELHQLLMPTTGNYSSPMLEVEIGTARDAQGSPQDFMNLQVAEAMPAAMAA
ncbi:MAG TPA: hypothetical protein VNG32_02235 [Candidatus Dormibacteraeota bacterium]|nr:hypothetical protein [Candidatus Dormibacteraeota bacterium]